MLSYLVPGLCLISLIALKKCLISFALFLCSPPFPYPGSHRGDNVRCPEIIDLVRDSLI